MQTAVPMARPAKQVVCSFCGSTREKTAKLIAGPGTLRICAECVHLCGQILHDEGPSPSQVRHTTLVLDDGTHHLVDAGLHEAVSMLGNDDARIVAFNLVAGGRLAVRRQAVRQMLADPEPEAEPRARPAWADTRESTTATKGSNP
jgi:hypothetical protein